MEVRFEEAEKQNAIDRLNLALWNKKASLLQASFSSDMVCTMSTSPEIDSIRAEAAKFSMDVVFCHNDLLSGNILCNKAWSRVQIIDYEYGSPK